MKDIIFLVVLVSTIALAIYGCHKKYFGDDEIEITRPLCTNADVDSVMTLLIQASIRMDTSTVRNLLMQRRACTEVFDTQDLLAMLTEYSYCALDLVPSIHSEWQQHANCGNAWWESSLHERVADSTTVPSELVPVDISWKIDGMDPVSTGTDFRIWFVSYNTDISDPNACDSVVWNPLWNQYQYYGCPVIVDTTCSYHPADVDPPCDGFHEVSVIMTMEDGSVYERAGTAHLSVNEFPGPSCDMSLADYNVLDLLVYFPGGELQEFEPYEFMISSGFEYDLDSDGCVNTADLLIFLTCYGP